MIKNKLFLPLPLGEAGVRVGGAIRWRVEGASGDLRVRVSVRVRSGLIQAKDHVLVHATLIIYGLFSNSAKSLSCFIRKSGGKNQL